MAGRGAFTAISVVDCERLLSANGPDAVFALEVEILEEGRGLFRCELDKAWETLDQCLLDEDLGPAGNWLHDCVLEEEPLAISGGTREYLYVKDEDAVRGIAVALAKLDDAWLRKRYDILAEEGQIDTDERDWDYTRNYFRAMQSFYVNAANAGLAVMFWCF